MNDTAKSQAVNLQELSRALRLKALEMAFHAGKSGAHLGGGLSVIEIMAALYGRVMNVSSADPTNPERDRLVVSKGHCVLAYYAALHYFGFISDGELAGFEVNGSSLHGHATRNVRMGIEFSGGSLSMGASFGVGVAMAMRREGRTNHVYVLVGDGECDEGLVWEASMAAANFKLDNLTMIVDANALQYDGPTSEIMDKGSLTEKFRAFGFLAMDVNGHDTDALVQAFGADSQGRPKAIVAHTVKGKGVSFMEQKREWHHSVLNASQYQQAIAEQG
ncbi:MAG: transketolase [Terracidiphilus sp.]|nr:transketolase [Terracidiphilus sp.]